MINLKKIKFPFKKIKYVCTTDQVVHQVDGKDKKLSEVLNSSGGPIVVDIGQISSIDPEVDGNEHVYTIPITNEPNDTAYILRSEIDKINNAEPCTLIILKRAAEETVIPFAFGVCMEAFGIKVFQGIGTNLPVWCSIYEIPDSGTVCLTEVRTQL